MALGFTGKMTMGWLFNYDDDDDDDDGTGVDMFKAHIIVLIALNEYVMVERQTKLDVHMSLSRVASPIVVPMSSVIQNTLTRRGLAVTSHWITRVMSAGGVVN